MKVSTTDLKVALVSPEYPPYVFGGIGSVCRDLAYNLSKNCVDTTVFCGGAQQLKVEKVNDFLTVVRMPAPGVPPRHFWFQFQNYNLLSGYLKDFDIIHNLDPRLGLSAHLAKRLCKPLVTHIHECGHCITNIFLKSPIACWSPGDFVFSVLEYPINDGLNRASLRASDHIIVCSKARLNELRNHHSKLPDASVIYNGITFEDSSECTPPVEASELSILFWGRLYYVKGVIQLIYALKSVVQVYPQVKLEVCGKGPLESQITSLIKKLGLEKNVQLNGHVSKTVLSEKINKATVIALPSLHEGQPMTALEAMSRQKTVVMLDHPFVREFITDHFNGLLAADVKELAGCISEALSDRRLRMKLGKNAFEYVRENHNWEKIVKSYIEVYDKMIAKG